MAKRIAEYARKRGIKTILPTMGNALVDDDFRRQYPDARYVKAQWLDAPPQYFIHPADPLFAERGAEALRENIATYGTDHIYNADAGYPESTFDLAPDEIEQMIVEWAGATPVSWVSLPPTSGTAPSGSCTPHGTRARWAPNRWNRFSRSASGWACFRPANSNRSRFAS